MDPDVLSAEEAAKEWLKENNLTLEGLSPGQQFRLTMQVPCSIRCWRAGVSITLGTEGICPECGKDHHFTFWDRLKMDAAVVGGSEEASRSKEPP